jgi:RNA polymerase sigma-70 factor (ECF subfamily)
MDLLRAARKGNQEALLHLFDEHHVPLFRFAYRMTRSVADAEDIVQECFLALLARDCAYDPARAPLRTYLFGAVHNLALARMRRREQPVDGSPPAAASDSPEAEAFRSELEQAVAVAVMHLPENQREVLLLAHYEKIPLADIGRILGVELSAVKSRLQRARASLKDTLAAYAPRAGRSV